MKTKTLLTMLLLLPILLFAQKKSTVMELKAIEKPLTTVTKTGYTIKGYIKGMNKGMITIRYRREGNDVHAPIEKDSMMVKDGHFAFSGSVDTPVYCSIWQPDYLVQIKFWLENAPVTIDGSVDSDNIKISGSKTQDEDDFFHKSYDDYSNKLMAKAYELKGAKNRKESQGVIDRIRKEQDSLVKCQRNFGEKFLREHPNSNVSLTYLYNCTSDEAERLFGYLTEDLRNSGGGKILIKKINIVKASAVGQVLPDCSQPDANGNELKFSDYRGKYLLISISSSVNQGLVNKLKQWYSKYHEKGLDIVDVFIDAKSKEELGKLSEEYKIPWKEVSDCKSFSNEVVENLNVNSFPSLLLVDPKGIILGRDLSAQDLEKKLSEIFK